MGRLILAGAVVAAVLAGAGLAAPSFVVTADERIGTFAVKRNGTLGGLEAAFGRPASLTRTPIGCNARWPVYGLRVSLYNLGGQNPCRPRTGYFGEAVLTGERWSTDRGLQIADTLARLRQLYPKAERHGTAWWLVPRFTQATGRYPGLLATLANGRVASFRVIYGAGGE